jgi:protein required for attachment to host cells
MTFVIVPHNAYIFVGDGSKALVLRNDGDAELLNLKIRPPMNKARIVRDGRIPRSAPAAQA